MPLPDSDADRTLIHHLEALHALARVLTGPEEAATLIQTIYEQAAQVPPQQRPSDERAWLFRLMVQARDGALRPGETEESSPDRSFTDDSFRREVAEETAERRLPVTFAACSLHERFILAVDVLGAPSDNILAAALDTSPDEARSVRDEARSALRASLRDLLRGPERMLVDVALPDDVLREQLRDLLLGRFHPAPPSLQSHVVDTLKRAQEQREEERASTESTFGAGVEAIRSFMNRAVDTVRRDGSLRSVIGGLAVLLVLGAGTAGAFYLFSSASAPSASNSIVDLSADRADRVELSLETDTPSRASAYARHSFDRRVAVPEIDAASLQGAGRLPLRSGTDVPAFLYTDDETGSQIVALAFNYALVDRLGNQATLAPNRRTKLTANETLLSEQRGDRAILLWRQRDDILVVVAPGLRADALRTRIRP